MDLNNLLNTEIKLQFGRYGTPKNAMLLKGTPKAIQIKTIEHKFNKDIFWIPKSVISQDDDIFIVQDFFKVD